LLCYAIYASPAMRAGRECMTTGLGNNVASLLAGLAILPAVFALAPLAGQDPHTLMGESGPASTGLTFVWMPVLFQQMPWGGRLLSILFFLGLAFAALSSLIAMVELGVRSLVDLGHPRRRAVWLTFGAGFLLGLPSALDIGGLDSLVVLGNQDWVWGVGLIVAGGLMGLSVIRFGVGKFWNELVAGPEGRRGGGAAFRLAVGILVPLQFAGLLGWWFYQAWAWSDGASARGRIAAWLDPLSTYSIGTCLVQWLVVLGLLRLFNRPLAARAAAGSGDETV
jgi:NSS family neurotransmitter:Na+ symporter